MDFLIVGLVLFKKCLGIIFDLKRPTFGCIFNSKVCYITTSNEIFCQKFAHFGGFDGSFLTILVVKKFVFWAFSKLFRKFLSIVFGLKRPTFGCICSSQG